MDFGFLGLLKVKVRGGFWGVMDCLLGEQQLGYCRDRVDGPEVAHFQQIRIFPNFEQEAVELNFLLVLAPQTLLSLFGLQFGRMHEGR